MSVHKLLVLVPLLLFKLILKLAVLFMHLYLLHIFGNQLLLMLLDSFVVALHEILISFRALLVFFSVNASQILVSLGA